MFRALLHAFYIQSILYDPSLIQTQGPPVLAVRVCGLRMCAIVPGLCGFVFSLCGVCAYACVYTHTHNSMSRGSHSHFLQVYSVH